MNDSCSKRSRVARILWVAFLTMILGGVAVAQELTQEERIAAMKQSLATSQETLKTYQWTETKTIFIDGDAKSSYQSKCHYGSDGKVAKEQIGTPTEPKEQKGLRGRRAKKKMKKVKEYMGRVMTLVGSYMPPDPAQLQSCQDAGKMGMDMVEPGKRIIVRFGDYKLAGDSVDVELDLVNNTLLGYAVTSYLDSPEDGVTLKVDFEALEDGTLYPALVVLNAEAEDLKAEIRNADYRISGN